MKYRWTLHQRSTLFEKYFRLDEYAVSHELFEGDESERFTREIFERGNVVALLPYDPAQRKVVLIEQFRAGAVDHQPSPWLVECVAGMIEPGETDEQVALRECVEEAGCEVGKLLPMYRYYVTPGGSTEYCSLFCGLVDSTDVGGIHGLAGKVVDAVPNQFAKRFIGPQQMIFPVFNVDQGGGVTEYGFQFVGYVFNTALIENVQIHEGCEYRSGKQRQQSDCGTTAVKAEIGFTAVNFCGQPHVQGFIPQPGTDNHYPPVIPITSCIESTAPLNGVAHH